MTTLELYEIADDKSRQVGIAGSLIKLAVRLATWPARRETILKLASLDAFQLADIGLERTDVEDALDGDARRLWARIKLRNAS
ncbi:MAG TPA: DUF1127 domain-containing protein [Devosia sp.]|jgi:uncharacterized protein YjiS (DUF1127 family)|uniref:DUF1127 domain-containing protein n=1 Tax=Devosia sp. TaxID=1871048 RepID=UPI002DDD4C6F|nr:DUF1127 domain-containing protein [Devosia sp.]HEV2513736.1 DUF1127 domain-containing protein [Devosia sp.]